MTAVLVESAAVSDEVLVTGRVGDGAHGPVVRCLWRGVRTDTANGGPFTLVADGDKITADVAKRRLDLNVGQSEPALRHANPWPSTPAS